MVEVTKVARKVVVITAHFPPIRSPEAEHALHLCENLARRGIQVDVLTSKGGGVTGNNGIRIHAIMREWSWSDLPRLIMFLWRRSPDGVLLMYIGWIYNDHPMITYAATIVKRLLARVTFVTQIENVYGANPSKTSLVARAIRKAIVWWAGLQGADYYFGTLLRDSDVIIVLSDRHRKLLSEYYEFACQKSVLVPPPPLLRIDSTQDGLARQRGRKNLGVMADEIVVTYFGYMYPGKGVETLLRAFQKLNRVAKGLRLILVGGTRPQYLDYRQMLYDLTDELGIGERLIWIRDYASDSYETARILQASDICVLPFDEGVYLNNSSFSAVAALGLPIISTQGSIVEPPFLHMENVFLCQPKSPDDLAAAIEMLITNPALRKRLGSGARRLAQEWFSWDKAAERTAIALKCETN